MPLGIICGRITPARGNLEHRPLSGAVTQKGQVRLSKLRQISQAAFAASSFSSWFHSEKFQMVTLKFPLKWIAYLCYMRTRYSESQDVALLVT